MFVEQLTQALAPQDIVPYQTVTNTTLNTNGVNMAAYKRAIWFVPLDSAGSAGTVAVTVQSAKLSNFATVHNLTGFTIPNMSANNTLITVEIRSDQLTQQQSGDVFCRLALTGAGNPVTIGPVIGLGGEAVQKPGGVGNLINTINTTTVVGQYICST